MSKIALIGDMHFSIRNGSPIFIKNINQFIELVFLPYITKHNIKVILQTGDLYDNRKKNDNLAINNSKEVFFDKLEKLDVEFHTIVGNHCMHTLNSTTPNSSELFLKEYKNVFVYNKPETVSIGGLNIDMIPWICEDNSEDIMAFIAKSTSKVCMAHPEITGFNMTKYQTCEHGLDRNVFKDYGFVIAGHFHEKSVQDNIHYLGSPTQHNFGDVGAERGFYVFDTVTMDVEFIPNPYSLFVKIDYTDDLEMKDTPDVEGKYVSIIVPETINVIKYRHFLEELWSFSPIDIMATQKRESIEVESDGGVSLEDLENHTFAVVPFLTKYTNKIANDTLDESVLESMYTKYYNIALESSEG